MVKKVMLTVFLLADELVADPNLLSGLLGRRRGDWLAVSKSRTYEDTG